jgi:hypothetical protein
MTSRVLILTPKTNTQLQMKLNPYMHSDFWSIELLKMIFNSDYLQNIFFAMRFKIYALEV